MAAQHLQLLNDSYVDYYPKFFEKSFADEILDLVLPSGNGPIPWKQDHVIVGKSGKPSVEPRLTAFLGEEAGLEYIYSEKRNVSTKWPPLIQKMKEMVEDLVGYKFNVVLMNCYQDGNQHVSWHSDSEAGLVDGAPIVSVSVGATRSFQLRHLLDSAIPGIQSAPGGIDNLFADGGHEALLKAVPCYDRQPLAAAFIQDKIKTMSVDELKSWKGGADSNLNKQVDLSHGDLLVMRGNLQKFWRHRIPKDATVTSPRVVFTFRAVEAQLQPASDTTATA
eukprot:TRINITY_DN86348_c0_g1_i1.p1 TRINITY_DN86348_c0_g1~~TRINITY_DN86348_c0_g1_i1.p1  ORF type:complete len:278 (+),score=27.40 TRINITY_DN86348_c0_g1_i1:65-898(+)